MKRQNYWTEVFQQPVECALSADSSVIFWTDLGQSESALNDWPATQKLIHVL
jgi:hypothetical protein